jgi:hypothetical protein
VPVSRWAARALPRWARRRPRRSVTSKRTGILAALSLAVALFVLSNDAPVQSQAVDLGDENSWIRVQNVGTAPATVEIDLFNNSGQRVATDTCPQSGACGPVQPGFGRSFFQQTLPDLPQNYRGSATISSDQPFTALLARDVLRADGEFQIAGDAIRLGPGSSEHVLPWVVNTADYVSRITVQNPNPDNGACVQIAYHQQAITSPRAVEPATASQQCPNGGFYLAPNASWVRDEHNIGAPFGFEGGALVRTQPVGGSGTRGQVQVTVDTRDRTAAGLATYRSISAEEVSRVVLLPLVDRNHTEGQSTFSTRFRIMNANPLLPNEVTLRFVGRTPGGEEFEVEHTLTVNAARTCDQRATGGNACLPPGITLPNQFSGTVRMQSVEPIAVVAQRVSNDGSLADYRGFTAEEASTQVVLPVLNKNFGPFGGNRGWNSWFRILTFDGSSARVFVVYYSSHFPDGLRPPAPITVQGQMTFRQWEHRGIPDGWVGSAVVVSDRPIVVVANLESDVFEGDPVMLYNGVALE